MSRGKFRRFDCRAALIVGCAFMILAPGNFARLEFAHPNFVYTEEIFFDHLTEGFDRVVGADCLALIPMFVYFLRRKTGNLTTPEILMLAFTTAGLLVPLTMLFSPEFNLRVSVPSLAFVLVASTSAILEMERQHLTFTLQLPKKFRMDVQLDNLRLIKNFNSCARDVLAPLLNLPNVKANIRLVVDMSIPEGVPTDIKEIVERNQIDLGIIGASFDD